MKLDQALTVEYVIGVSALALEQTLDPGKFRLRPFVGLTLTFAALSLLAQPLPEVAAGLGALVIASIMFQRGRVIDQASSLLGG